MRTLTKIAMGLGLAMGLAQGAWAQGPCAELGGEPSSGVTVVSPGVDLGRAVLVEADHAPAVEDLERVATAAGGLEAGLAGWGRWAGVEAWCSVEFASGEPLPAGFPWGAEYLTTTMERDGQGGLAVVHVYWRPL